MSHDFPGDLKTADWPYRKSLMEIRKALGSDNIRWVGGAVRDTLLGVEVADVDCATTLTPDVVIDRCREAGIRIVPTGIDHGTVTAVFDEGPVEITTLRRDVSTDGRRATVAFAQEWHEDAARRDFTINALFAHPETLKISDYFGGLYDLADRRVRFIGDARERIREDHLRILRYYRFQARFGSQLDPEAEEACAELRDTLKGLSRERIADELLKLLGLPDPYETVARMQAKGVLAVILPESGKCYLKGFKRLIAAEMKQGFAPDAIRRLAALLPPSPDVASTVARRLRLSNAQRARLSSAAERLGEGDGDQFSLAYTIGTTEAIDRLLMDGIDARLLIDWTPPRLPLKGGEIVERGVEAGPDVAKMLRRIEQKWVEEGFPGRDRVEELLDQELANR